MRISLEMKLMMTLIEDVAEDEALLVLNREALVQRHHGYE
jgi:hypothetical protein